MQTSKYINLTLMDKLSQMYELFQIIFWRIPYFISMLVSVIFKLKCYGTSGEKIVPNQAH